VRWRHQVAPVVEQLAREEMRRLPACKLSCNRLVAELGLNRLEQVQIKNRLMLALVDLAAINDLADIEAVLQEVGKRSESTSKPGAQSRG